MLYIICMVAGLLLSRALRLERIARPIGWAQTAVTLILIACMGYRLGSRPDFINELSSMGLMSLLYCIVPSVFSIALVYVVTRFLTYISSSSWSSSESRSASTKGSSRS